MLFRSRKRETERERDRETERGRKTELSVPSIPLQDRCIHSEENGRAAFLTYRQAVVMIK